MDNVAIAKIFESIANLLEVKGDSPFKIRAYQRATRTIEHLPVPAGQLLAEGRLRELPGIGEELAKKIAEMVATGRLGFYERLRAEFPEGLLDIMGVPGVGPKIAGRLWKELGVTTLEGLEEALSDGRVAALPRLGEKTAQNILRQLQALRRKDQRLPIGEALPLAEELLATLKDTPGLRNLTYAGSLRRWRETVGDIDLVGTADHPEKVVRTFVELPMVGEVMMQGPQRASVRLRGGFQADLRLVPHGSFGSLLQHFTGSQTHNILLRERARGLGLSLSEYGITNLATGALETFLTEEEVYHKLGLQCIPPELREGEDEVERAAQGAISPLVELGDIRGDLHVHTNWSDGHNPLEEMARAAQALGYEYIAITDHSLGRAIANGLSPQRLREQAQVIKELNSHFSGFRLFTGTEVDIRADGSLDFPDEVLAELDVVVASVHSAMGQDRAKMTERVIRAMKNPHVDIIGHLTCRLIGEREPVDLDLEAIFRAASETGTALEINANPSRLDLKDAHVKLARELGVALIISSDAHAPEHLNFARYGVEVARRGWCQATHILNTRSLEGFRGILESGGFRLAASLSD